MVSLQAGITGCTSSLPCRRSWPARSHKKAALRHADAKHDPNAGRQFPHGSVIGHAAGRQIKTTAISLDTQRSVMIE